MLLGAGELGKEIAIEAQRLGLHVIAADRYDNAPAMQVADESRVLDMTDGAQLCQAIDDVQPDIIVPEIEAIATDRLTAYEERGVQVVPSAKAVQLTMNREGIRRLAAETLKLPTSEYRFVDDFAQLTEAVEAIGLPCIVKPVMSSSGKGQSMIRHADEVRSAWEYAQSGGRTGAGRVIVESVVKFDFEITLLTVRHAQGVTFCEPIGHVQKDGDYQESWQPQAMTHKSLATAKEIATRITEALGGCGVFGVELFVRGDDVIFSEVSPRPHDTGMVTMIAQDLSQFALHVRAILGHPVPKITQYGPSASHVIIAEGHGNNPRFIGVEAALSQPETALRLFGKPTVQGRRRVGVCLAAGHSLNAARKKAADMAAAIQVELD